MGEQPPSDRLSNEERFFREQDEQLRKRMREKAEKLAAEHQAKNEITQHVGENESLAKRIHALGLEGDAVRALHLLPLVEVAWADGAVSAREREAILQAVEAHGIEPGSDAGNFIAAMLEERPSTALLREIRSLLHDLLKSKGLSPRTVLDECEAVAEASGGFLGLTGKVSAAEKDAIARITKALKEDY